VAINQTGQIGNGKIFVCPIDSALRVRTSEEGETAIL
jgi:nitrogen regulatory protein PII 2